MELISFENPSEAKVFLPRIRWKGDRVELVELLRSRLEPYGLVHHVFADRSRGPTADLGES